MCLHLRRASCQINWAVWQVHPSAPREHNKSNSDWQLYGNDDDYGGSSTHRVKLIDSDGCVNCSRWGDGRRVRAQEMPECRGKEKPLNRGVHRVSFNFPLFYRAGLMDESGGVICIFIVVISQEVWLLVAHNSKCRPPSLQHSSLSKSRAFPLRLPAFGLAVIDEDTETVMWICDQ